ncbi:MAG: hypothetical protein R3181_12795, partial [Rubricoccaceae bacterium]|nr:hypothetical protein [Rubricoccaceae bacterium]
MPLTLRPRPAALLLALLTLAACDSAGEDEAAFTATLSGAVDARLEGEASFGTDAEAGALRFLILLQADEDRSGGVEGSVGFYVDGETRPAEGTYAVGEADGTAALIVLVDAQGSLSLT